MMNPLKLTADHEQLLRDQVIDDTHPGPVLHNFQVVLDRIGTEGVPAGGKYNLLPIELIPELDGQLTRPLHLTLKMKRPQLRSHPYLQGLHLLLRATGLVRVEGTDAKARLVVAAEVLQSWQALNATERYFTLLEAWLLHGRGEMVGERSSAWDLPGGNVMRYWQYLNVQGVKLDLKRPQEVYLYPLGRNFYHVALLDLFGLLEVEHPHKPVQPWCPAGIKHTPFGDAVFTLLARQAEERFDLFDEVEDEGGVRFGQWQSLFQPYFPKWQNNLTVPEAAPSAGIFFFRVSLGKVWRMIAIDADSTLDDLVGCILDSVDFDFDHLYEFSYRDRFGRQIAATHPYCDEGPHADDITIGDLPLKPGETMDLLYDFGDSWRFKVKLDRIEEKTRLKKLPRVVEEHGKAPEQYPSWD